MRLLVLRGSRYRKFQARVQSQEEPSLQQAEMLRSLQQVVNRFTSQRGPARDSLLSGTHDISFLISKHDICKQYFVDESCLCNSLFVSSVVYN